MLLQKLVIKNFKGIGERQEIDLSVSNKTKEGLKNNLMFKNEGKSLIPLIVGFMGKNASGKTSIIDALEFTIGLIFRPEILFNQFYSQKTIAKSKIDKYPFSMDASNENNDLKNIFIKNNKLINNFVQLSFENKIKIFPNEYSLFLEALFNDFSCDQKNPIELEMLFINDQDIYKTKLNLSKKELIRLTYKNEKKIEIERFPIIVFSDLKFDNNPIENSQITLKLQWNLIELIGLEKYNLILRMIDNNVKEINFTIDNAKKIKFTSLHMNNGAIMPFHFLSSGTIKILKFIAIMMIKNSKYESKKIFTIFLADEIGNYLHPKLVHFLFNLLSKQLFNSQLLFTTHSPVIIENLNRHAVWVIQNEEHIKIKKVGSIMRENNNFHKKFISEEISSHPSDSAMNEVLYELAK